VPVHVLTTRVVDGDKVTAVAMRPFLVLDPGEGSAQAEAELQRVIEELEALKGDLEAARLDETHPHHHWWRR
jgi:hypothetical protein